MRQIITNNFKILMADLITHPPVATEEHRDSRKKKKKKKKLYQLNRMVDDVSI